MYSKIYTTNNLIHNVAYGLYASRFSVSLGYRQTTLQTTSTVTCKHLCLTVDKRQLIPVELGLQAHTIGTG